MSYWQLHENALAARAAASAPCAAAVKIWAANSNAKVLNGALPVGQLPRPLVVAVH